MGCHAGGLDFQSTMWDAARGGKMEQRSKNPGALHGRAPELDDILSIASDWTLRERSNVKTNPGWLNHWKHSAIHGPVLMSSATVLDARVTAPGRAVKESASMGWMDFAWINGLVEG